MVFIKCASAGTIRKIPRRKKISAFKFQHSTFNSYLVDTYNDLCDNMRVHLYVADWNVGSL